MLAIIGECFIYRLFRSLPGIGRHEQLISMVFINDKRKKPQSPDDDWDFLVFAY